MHSPAEKCLFHISYKKCTFLKKYDFPGRKMHFRAEKCTSLQKNAIFERHITGKCTGGLQGSRVMSASVLSQDAWQDA